MLAFQAGDQSAFGRLFDGYKRQIISYCHRFCGNAAVAEELAQETFLRVYKAAPRYRPTAKFKTWLYKIATNICLNEMRRPIHRTPMASLDHNPHSESDPPLEALSAPEAPSRPDRLIESREQQAHVMGAIHQLPEKQRAALLLRINGTFAYREIATQLGCSENHVKTLIHRGRKQLKKILRNKWGTDHE